MGVTHVIWDWNGTLFDDLGCCIDVANRLLSEFDLPTLDGVAAYHAVFKFPIIDYYADLGFDTSPTGNFERAAHRYIELYTAASKACGLHDGALDALASIKAAGLSQALISASKQSNLDAQRAPFALDRWLEGAYGIADIYAHSKQELVQTWMNDQHVSPSQVLMVGDSEHDFEIADALGAHCVLFSGGHHAREHLQGLGAPVVDALADAVAYALSSQSRTPARTIRT